MEEQPIEPTPDQVTEAIDSLTPMVAPAETAALQEAVQKLTTALATSNKDLSDMHGSFVPLQDELRSSKQRIADLEIAIHGLRRVLSGERLTSDRRAHFAELALKAASGEHLSIEEARLLRG